MVGELEERISSLQEMYLRGVEATGAYEASSRFAMATRCALERRVRSMSSPEPSCTILAPGCTCGPLMTAVRSSATFQGVMGSGYVSVVAKWSGTPTCG